MKPSIHTAIVLSGGGARGAYEVGVVAGIVDVTNRDAGRVLLQEVDTALPEGVEIGLDSAGIDVDAKFKPEGQPFLPIPPEDGKCDECHRAELEFGASLRE